MDEPRKYFFADAGFTENENRNIRSCNRRGCIPDLQHLWAAGNEEGSFRR